MILLHLSAFTLNLKPSQDFKRGVIIIHLIAIILLFFSGLFLILKIVGVILIFVSHYAIIQSSFTHLNCNHISYQHPLWIIRHAGREKLMFQQQIDLKQQEETSYFQTMSMFDGGFFILIKFSNPLVNTLSDDPENNHNTPQSSDFLSAEVGDPSPSPVSVSATDTFDWMTRIHNKIAFNWIRNRLRPTSLSVVIFKDQLTLNEIRLLTVFTRIR